MGTTTSPYSPPGAAGGLRVSSRGCRPSPFRQARQPGAGSNTVFAGRGLAFSPDVFYKLNQLQTGDTIRLVRENGTVLLYSIHILGLALSSHVSDLPAAIAGGRHSIHTPLTHSVAPSIDSFRPIRSRYVPRSPPPRLTSSCSRVMNATRPSISKCGGEHGEKRRRQR